VSTEPRPFDHEPDHDPDPDTDEFGVDDDVDAVGETADASQAVNLRELEPDWEASEADVLDQHRDVPLDDDDR
jgi:hypothetical protein